VKARFVKASGSRFFIQPAGQRADARLRLRHLAGKFRQRAKQQEAFHRGGDDAQVLRQFIFRIVRLHHIELLARHEQHIELAARRAAARA